MFKVNPKVVYPKLNFKIMKAVFRFIIRLAVVNREKHHQRALEEEFKLDRIKYKKQLFSIKKYRSRIIGRYFVDFLVEDKLVLELA